MKSIKHIEIAYNKVAKSYADKFFHELANKAFDKIILREFAKHKHGLMVDIGCGPGQTTKFLFECGVREIIGLDLSIGNIKEAIKRSPYIKFEVGNMLKLAYPHKYFSSAIAFFAIVHFDLRTLKMALNEVHRVLEDRGEFLFSFHVGNKVLHYDFFLDHRVDIDFQFFETMDVIQLVKSVGFELIEAIERYPYDGFEYPSKRAYLWVKKL